MNNPQDPSPSDQEAEHLRKEYTELCQNVNWREATDNGTPPQEVWTIGEETSITD